MITKSVVRSPNLARAPNLPRSLNLARAALMCIACCAETCERGAAPYEVVGIAQCHLLERRWLLWACAALCAGRRARDAEVCLSGARFP